MLTSRATYEKVRLAVILMFNSSNRVAQDLNENDRRQISAYFFSFIMEKLRDMISLYRDINTFDYQKIIQLTIDEAMEKIAHGSSRNHIHWAPTQSGKSAFKAVKIITYLAMNIPVIVVTKGKGESEELFKKLSSFLKGSMFEKRIFSVYDKRQERIQKRFRNSLLAYVLVIPDTHQKIKYTRKLLSTSMRRAKKDRRRIAGCALILDEVDAIIDRSENEDQENEKALKRLIRVLNPYLVMVTATPIPVLSKWIDSKPIVTTSNETIKNYAGVQDMKLYDDLDTESLIDGYGGEGEKITPKYTHQRSPKYSALLKTDESQPRMKFPNVWKKNDANIPRFNAQCEKLLRQEMTKKHAKGMLALVSTCPWVNGEKNPCIFDQAGGAQDYFFAQKIPFIAVVVHATHIFYRLPDHKYGFKCNSTLDKLIDRIDSNAKYGLKMPVVVFGYHGMKRSRSFRSKQRVPSCMIMCLGRGQSNENCRQAAGRLTFKGRDLLQRNRKTEKVPILCSTEDFQMIQKHDRLVREILELYEEEGMAWNEIESSLSVSSENWYLEDSKRRTGNYVPGHKKRKRQKTRELPSSNGVVFSKTGTNESSTARNDGQLLTSVINESNQMSTEKASNRVTREPSPSPVPKKISKSSATPRMHIDLEETLKASTGRKLALAERKLKATIESPNDDSEPEYPKNKRRKFNRTSVHMEMVDLVLDGDHDMHVIDLTLNDDD